MKTRMLGAGMMAAMLVFAGVSVCAAEAQTAAPAPESKAAAAAKPTRAPMTPEQRAEMRAKRVKAMAERRAAMRAEELEIVKKYVPDEAKAKALLEELAAVRHSNHRVPGAAAK